MDKNHGRRSSVIIDFSNLDFPFFRGFYNGVDQRFGGGGERYFSDREGLVVEFFDLGPDPDFTAACTVVISADIYEASGSEVGIERELFIAKISDGSIEYFRKIMRKNE